MALKFENEAALAKVIVEYLQSLQWVVYQEVQLGLGGPVADIVAQQGRLLWVIETKMSLGLTVLGQAENWRRFANYVSVATPKMTRRNSDYQILHRIFKMTGVGWLKVEPTEPDDRFRLNRIYQEFAPRLNRRRSKHATSDLGKYLVEEQINYAPAGNADGRRWTPFGQTCDNIRRKVREFPGLPFKELMTGLETHYVKESTARSCIRQWISKGAVKGVRVEKCRRNLRVFPCEPGHERESVDTVLTRKEDWPLLEQLDAVA